MTDIAIAGLTMLAVSASAVVALTFFYRTNSVLRVTGWRSERLLGAQLEAHPHARAPLTPIALADFMAATDGAASANAKEPEAERPAARRPSLPSEAPVRAALGAHSDSLQGAAASH